MNLTSPAAVKTWCAQNGFHPSRSLGQNFLIDRNTRDAIVADSRVQPGQCVLEVGPGLGVLTQALLEHGARVTAVEKDHRLARWLRDTLATNHPGLTLIEGDMLKQPLDALLAADDQISKSPNPQIPKFQAVISNLPYSVGTRILVDLALHPLAPPRFTLLLQTEVTERLAAPAGHAGRALLSVLIQRLYDVLPEREIPPTCFYPRPEVDSTLVTLVRHDRFPLTPDHAGTFIRLVRHAFTHRRKQLLSILRKLPAPLRLPDDQLAALLASLHIPPGARPETLALADWCALAAAWHGRDAHPLTLK